MAIPGGRVDLDLGAVTVALDGAGAGRLPRRRRPAHGKEVLGLGDEATALVTARREQGLDALARLGTQALVHGSAIPAAGGGDEEMNRALGIVRAHAAGAGREGKQRRAQ